MGTVPGAFFYRVAAHLDRFLVNFPGGSKAFLHWITDIFRTRPPDPAERSHRPQDGARETRARFPDDARWQRQTPSNYIYVNIYGSGLRVSRPARMVWVGAPGSGSARPPPSPYGMGPLAEHIC